MRMTDDEGLLMDALELACEDSETAARALIRLGGNTHVGEPLSVAYMAGRALRGV
jgi:hypothetical protein